MKNKSKQQVNKACFNPYYTPDYIVKAIDYLQNNKAMTKLVTQHYEAEWHIDEGVRIVVARVYVGSKRTSAYVPMPPGHWPDGIPYEMYRKVQEMYREDDAKEF
jgi:hypothetical protein